MPNQQPVVKVGYILYVIIAKYILFGLSGQSWAMLDVKTSRHEKILLILKSSQSVRAL